MKRRIFLAAALLPAASRAQARPPLTGGMRVKQPTTFALAINASAAKASGLQVPKNLVLRADLVVD